MSVDSARARSSIKLAATSASEYDSLTMKDEVRSAIMSMLTTETTTDTSRPACVDACTSPYPTVVDTENVYQMWFHK